MKNPNFINFTIRISIYLFIIIYYRKRSIPVKLEIAEKTKYLQAVTEIMTMDFSLNSEKFYFYSQINQISLCLSIIIAEKRSIPVKLKDAEKTKNLLQAVAENLDMDLSLNGEKFHLHLERNFEMATPAPVYTMGKDTKGSLSLKKQHINKVHI